MNFTSNKIIISYQLLISTIKNFRLVILFYAVSLLLSCNNPHKPVRHVSEKLSIDEQSKVEQLFSAEKVRQIDSFMLSLTSRGLFNGSLLVSYDQNILYQKVFGWSDLKEKVPLTDSSVFQLASVSKQFTAVAVIILKEKGELNYDDDITKYLPDVPYRGITIRNLLNHTSGLPNYMWVLEHNWKQPVPPDNRQAMDLFSRQNLGLFFRPGSRFSYSNTNYFFLATIVEKISGMNFPDFAQKYIFRPAGMKHSYIFSAALNREYPGRVKGYRRCRSGFGYIDDTVNDGVTGDKGVYTTSCDLFRWDLALNNNLLVSATAMKEASMPLVLNNGKEKPYGFGQRLMDKDGKEVIYHNGLWNGFRSSFYRFSANKSAIVVLNNVNSSINRQIVDEIEKILDQEPPAQFTKTLARILIRDGLTNALSYLGITRSLHPGIRLNPDNLNDLANLFYYLNKPVLATEAKKLYSAVLKSSANENGS
ncbi:MAG: serine hydrolase [Bacteroidia bacterium]|nr:serine hydrolase [Bacteroidia bacterium]